MAETDVTLSDGSKLKVKRLGLFELDTNVPKPEMPGHYTVTILYANGTIEEAPFDITEPREKPEKPFEECEERTQDWYKWRQYHRWQNGIAHYHRQLDGLSAYFSQVEAYILENCVAPEDVGKIENWNDFDLVYAAAIPALPSWSDIEALAESLWQAKKGDVAILEAFQGLEGSDISYDWMPQATYSLMYDLAVTGDELLDRWSKDEITGMMLSKFVPKMIEALQSEDLHKQMKAQNDIANQEEP